MDNDVGVSLDHNSITSIINRNSFSNNYCCISLFETEGQLIMNNNFFNENEYKIISIAVNQKFCLNLFMRNYWDEPAFLIKLLWNDESYPPIIGFDILPRVTAYKME